MNIARWNPPSDEYLRSRTDLDDALNARLLALGYTWHCARQGREVTWYRDEGGQLVQNPTVPTWRHMFKIAPHALGFSGGKTREELVAWAEGIEEYNRCMADLRRVGWEFSDERHHEWDELFATWRSGGDWRRLADEQMERREADLDDAEAAAQLIANIQRWHRQGLSKREMIRRIGGDKTAGLKLISLVINRLAEAA